MNEHMGLFCSVVRNNELVCVHLDSMIFPSNIAEYFCRLLNDVLTE